MIAIVGAGGCGPTVPPQPVTRRTEAEPNVVYRSFDDALDAARTSNRRVFVHFAADWCRYCAELEADVLDTPAGRELLADVVRARLDYDDATNRPVLYRYVVLEMPTDLFVTASGNLLGRIEGYEGPRAWMQDADEALRAQDPLPGLERAHRDDPQNRQAEFAYADALLTGGYPEPGEARLNRLAEGDDSVAAAALFLLARYHQRGRRNFTEAISFWERLTQRFPQSENTEGAFLWWARALSELGRVDEALTLLDSRSRNPNASARALLTLARFVTRVSAPFDRAELAARLRARLGDLSVPNHRREAEELASDLGAR